MRTGRRPWTAAFALTAGAALAVLAAVVAPTSAQASVPVAAQPTGTITVFAAASLTGVFNGPMKAAFEKRYPGTTVVYTFGGSPTLVTQIRQGAPADVLATADVPNMNNAISNGSIAVRRTVPLNPVLFARNTMAIAMPKNNPARIRTLQDLARPGVRVGMCAAGVPCGTNARLLLAKNGVSVTPVNLTTNVTQLLAQVQSGDLDAGIVFQTDVRSAQPPVASVLIPGANNVYSDYPIAVVNGAPNPVGARAFVDYVRYTISAQGILRAWGFAKPW
ncbi:MAG: molybdate ABC transporter substrate-binding protein [Candidatus Nanopelagicales bacterium]|jgi:molybdate transport system substrate-binding protein